MLSIQAVRGLPRLRALLNASANRRADVRGGNYAVLGAAVVEIRKVKGLHCSKEDCRRGGT